MKATIRALLVTLGLCVGVLAGLPVPMTEKGSERYPELARFAQRVASVRDQLIAPFQPLFHAFLLGERWNLFSGGNAERWRLWIETRASHEESFHLLYRSHDPEHTAYADLVEHRRVRGAWNLGRRAQEEGYVTFARWIAGKILRERPEVAAVRVRLERVQVRPRGEGLESTGLFPHDVQHGRGGTP